MCSKATNYNCKRKEKKTNHKQYKIYTAGKDFFIWKQNDDIVLSIFLTLRRVYCLNGKFTPFILNAVISKVALNETLRGYIR